MTAIALPQFRAIPWRAGLTLLAVAWLLWVWFFLLNHPIGVDTYSYWQIDQGDLYGKAMRGEEYRYLYSPVFAQLVAPLTALPWPIFNGLWLTASMLALVYMLGPIGAGAILLIPTSPVWWELSAGNIHLLLAAAIVYGLRHPSAWAFVLLTKVTPGIGLLWFAVRREWHALGLAVGATIGLILASVLVGGITLWVDWVRMLTSVSSAPGPYSIAVPLTVRLPLAVVILSVGAWRGWAWSVPLASMLALPLLWMWHSFAMLVAIWPLRNITRSPESQTFAALPLAR